MESLDDDELVQMVQDFIESEPQSPTNSNSLNCHTSINHGGQYFVLQDILNFETSGDRTVQEFVLKHMRDKRDAEKTTDLKKWLVKRLQKYGLDSSLCHTSWVTSLGCPADYEYIEATVEDGNGNSLRLIIDIDFRSQFELARPTQAYQELTNLLPTIFVGTEKKLCKIISILCSAAKQSLRDRGLHVPPWRTTSYMQSKWFSGCHRDPVSAGFGREKGVEAGYNSSWVPPTPRVKSKKKDLGGGSGLSIQLSNMSINCC